MFDTMNIQMSERGVFVLPKALREAYRLEAGHNFTLLDIGGVFVLSPRTTEIDVLADRIADTLINKGETLESMIKALREEREQYNGQS
jgi:bifunctional DNA-binding transcriptional regulator/antitoxin component of YhaV-PrlF toxin-antitoxin module